MEVWKHCCVEAWKSTLSSMENTESDACGRRVICESKALLFRKPDKLAKSGQMDVGLAD